MSEIARFLEAQEKDYETALKEIKQGKKESCWIWYIFPQIQGLGNSSLSEKYSIKDIEEAKEYLENETLKARLIEITQALLDLEEKDIKSIMGYPDDLKLKSSMTLFKKVEEIYEINCDNIFQKTLDKFFNGEEDNNTIRILEKQKFEKQIKQNKEKDNEENINAEKPKEENNINNNDDLENKGMEDSKDNEETTNEKKEIKEDNFDFEYNQKVDDLVVEKENDDEMLIKEEIDEDNKENDKHKDEGNDNFKNDELNIRKENAEIENDMIIEEEKKNETNQEENDNNNLNNVDSDATLNKKKSVHYSLPSRSQMKSRDIGKKSEVEMVIDNTNLDKKQTVVIYPYDEKEDKKCCPECCIF